eukprot:scaffold1052_cov198-Alexandrium_tamarense.AAC.11
MHLHLLNAPGVLGARGAADKSNGVNELSVMPEDVVKAGALGRFVGWVLYAINDNYQKRLKGEQSTLTDKRKKESSNSLCGESQRTNRLDTSKRRHRRRGVFLVRMGIPLRELPNANHLWHHLGTQ